MYIPLDFESRYVGKEVIGMFGNGLGKSGMSIVLSGLTAAFGSFGLQFLSMLSAIASCSWLAVGLGLSKSVAKTEETKSSSPPAATNRMVEDDKNK